MTQCQTVPGTQPINLDPVKPSQNKFCCSQEELKRTLYGMGEKMVTYVRTVKQHF